MEFTYQDGIHLATCDLWLDPHRPRAAAVISHAHADHVRRHEVAFATHATADLLRNRYKFTNRTIALDYAEGLRYGDATITFHPAGHVLGSAQILVETAGHRLLYSGDLRLRRSEAAEPATVPQADCLIVETTFGRPHYLFPPDEEVAAAIVHFCRETLAARAVPVLFAYSLGKAQQAMMLLRNSGFALQAHPSALKLHDTYRRHGIALPDCAPLGAAIQPNTVVICPPQARTTAAVVGLGERRTAMLSGWALDRGARYRYRCDAVFPFSDHCGYDDLLTYVEVVGARRVFTTHGFAQDFASDLRHRGIEAYPVDKPLQLALPGFM